MSIEEKFDAVNDDYLKFDRVENKRSKRKDMHAFLLLEELFPDNEEDIISYAGHDEICLGLEYEDVEKLTDEQILELTRCGIMYNSAHDCLTMFV